MIIKNYLKNNKNLIFRIIAFTFLSTIFISLIPICTKLVIDNYSNLNVSNAIFYSLFYILSILLFLFFEYKKKVSIVKFGYNYSVNIKYEIFNSITRMSQKNINTKSNGDIINAITNDAEIVYENYIYSYISLIISGISLLVYLTYMFYLNWILSIVIIISAIISFFIPKLVGKNMSVKRKEFSDKTATLIHNLENLLEGRELFNYCTSDSFSRKFQNYNEINYSISENIKISNPTKAPGKEILDIVTNIYNKDVNSLSMGEKARVNIARALNTYHNVIILDEFFANIDTKSEYDLTKLLLKTNKTIILVTHNTDDEYLKLFDEVIEINNYM
ncbi:ABC transporter transmembrane domain-containing protein [Helcococcus kunzii]|uniref:ABC transporter transmembrane domain-containing protein n=1 Tax=Helcococcus kunzii TaxID=40091 RepID=UPI0020165FA5|nr:ABC transporter transmembrane domain-containing protein [Helcococcus kunzii]MCT1796781.1 ABC transporter transmembrane domain-containing protein [Helcococcus kunzii]MCT1988629.1 ABC transporter transmembrane domain-containing protein [Helcococcus kunzii]